MPIPQYQLPPSWSAIFDWGKFQEWRTSATDYADTYPTHLDLLWSWGFRCANIAERNNTPLDRRKRGMFVVIWDPTDSQYGKFFQLNTNTHPTNPWVDWNIMNNSNRVEVNFWNASWFWIVDVVIPVSGQTSFTVTVPTYSYIEMWVNGDIYYEWDGFSITGNNLTVTLPFQLETTDSLRLRYSS